MEIIQSIIIPTLNDGRVLEKSLLSAVNQNYDGQYEIIVVDGGSRDETLSIAKKYANKIIRTNRRGVARQRNLGAVEAKGNILIFLDADTILPKNYLKKVVYHFANKKPVMVLGKFLPDEKHIKAKFTCWVWTEILPRVSKIIKKPGYGGPSVFAIDKKAFQDVGGFDNELPIFEDWKLCMEVSQFGKIIYDKSLQPITSMRRFEKNGYLNEYAYWIKQYYSFLSYGKPAVKSYEPVEQIPSEA